MVEDIPKDRASRNPTTQHCVPEHFVKSNNNLIDIWQKKDPKRKNIPMLIT